MLKELFLRLLLDPVGDQNRAAEKINEMVIFLTSIRTSKTLQPTGLTGCKIRKEMRKKRTIRIKTSRLLMGPS